MKKTDCARDRKKGVRRSPSTRWAAWAGRSPTRQWSHRPCRADLPHRRDPPSARLARPCDARRGDSGRSEACEDRASHGGGCGGRSEDRGRGCLPSTSTCPGRREAASRDDPRRRSLWSHGIGGYGRHLVGTRPGCALCGSLLLAIGGQVLERSMAQRSGEADQGVRGGAPALNPERTIALLADPHIVTGLQAEPVPEVGREDESPPVIKTGIPTEARHVGKSSSRPPPGSGGLSRARARSVVRHIQGRRAACRIADLPAYATGAGSTCGPPPGHVPTHVRRQRVASAAAGPKGGDRPGRWGSAEQRQRIVAVAIAQSL